MDATTQPLLLAKSLAAAAAGDRGAFAKLYEYTSAKLFAVVLRIVKENAVAEEVLQEVYVSIWSHAPDYDSQKSQPMTWMIAIARNRALDYVRRGRLDHTPWEESYDDIIADETLGNDSPLAAAIEKSEAQVVKACIKRLEGNYRQAITLGFYEGMSHSEIAAHLQQPLGTIKSHIRRGLMRLKACLGL